MSFKSSIWAGRCGDGALEPVESISADRFVAVCSRFADRDTDGKILEPLKRPGWEQLGPKKLLGYIANEFVIYHNAGFVEAVFYGIDPRLVGFLAAVCRELQCRLIEINSGELMTDHFMALAKSVLPGERS
jgi:hypothetical protein